MKEMEDRILTQGEVLPGHILKVGNFLNQQIDSAFLSRIGEEIASLFAESGVTKVMTIESSGIAIAASVGMAMNVPIIFAKKHKSSNVDGKVLSTTIHSYTHGNYWKSFLFYNLAANSYKKSGRRTAAGYVANKLFPESSLCRATEVYHLFYA